MYWSRFTVDLFMSFAPVLRLVQVRLQDNHRDPDTVARIGQAAHAVFRDIPGVTDFEYYAPAVDENPEWDMVLLVGFNDLDDVEPYRVHDLHVAFVEEHLKPVMASIQAVNHVQAGS